MTFPDHNRKFEAAIVEGIRWWFSYDEPRSFLIRSNSGQVSKGDVRSIALTYNFTRNIPADDAIIERLAEHVNAFSGKVFDTFSDRATELEASIKSRQEAIDKPERKRNFRIVSGMTKLTWFVAPTNWTPFNRLAAKAVRARKTDTLERMMDLYRILDASGFAEAPAIITVCAKGTPFQDVSGERILDKYLMGYGEADWTDALLSENAAFEQALTASWRRDVDDFKNKILSSAATKFSHKAFQ